MKKIMCAICLSLLVLWAGTAGATLALYKDQADVNNKISIEEVKASIEEKVQGGAKTNVQISIPEDAAECWVRVCLTLPTTLMGKDIYKVKKADGFYERWTQDGEYYYSTRLLEPGKKYLLFDSISANSAVNLTQLPDNYDVILYAEAVQYNGEENGIEAFNKFEP